MKRAWFRDEQGYYRNCPLIMTERRRCLGKPRRYRRLRQLDAEWQETWRKGLIRKPQLGRGDVLVQPRPFREAYPDKPGLWCLDDLERWG